MKKIKLIAPLLGLTAITPMIAPVLTSCGNKPSADEVKLTINGKESGGEPQGITIAHATPKKNTPFVINFATADTWKVEDSSFTIKVGQDKILTSDDYDVVRKDTEKTVTIHGNVITDNINITINSVQESVIPSTIETQYAFYDYTENKYYADIEGFSCKNIDIEKDLQIEVLGTTGFKATPIKTSTDSFYIHLVSDTQVFSKTGYNFNINLKTLHSKELYSQKNVEFWIMPATPDPFGVTQVAPASSTKKISTNKFVTAINSETMQPLDLNTVMKIDTDVENCRWYRRKNSSEEWKAWSAYTAAKFEEVSGETNKSKLVLTFEGTTISEGYQYKATPLFKVTDEYGGGKFKYELLFNCIA